MLDAITDLVAANGYAGTTVREVVREAGVSLSTFYERFADKRECFLAAYDRVADQLIAAIGDEVAKAAGPWEALEAGIAAYFRWGAEHPNASATFVVEIHTAGAEALARRARIIERFNELVAQAPGLAARGHGTEARLPSAAIPAVTYTMDAMSHEYVRQGRAAELPSLIPDAQEIALHILRR
jgi:AcrR family transcriptional regulator